MGALPQLYPYKAGPIEPIAMPGETLGVWVHKIYYFYDLVYIEPIPASDPLVLDLGAIAAGGVSGINQLTLLEMPDKELGQFRSFVLDDIHATLWQGRSDGRYKTKNRQANISLFTQLNDPDGHTTEFFVYKNEFAFMNALNPTSYALTQARVGFYGFRYVLEVARDPRGKEYKWSPGTPENNVPNIWTRVPATAHL